MWRTLAFANDDPNGRSTHRQRGARGRAAPHGRDVPRPAATDAGSEEVSRDPPGTGTDRLPDLRQAKPRQATAGGWRARTYAHTDALHARRARGGLAEADSRRALARCGSFRCPVGGDLVGEGGMAWGDRHAGEDRSRTRTVTWCDPADTSECAGETASGGRILTETTIRSVAPYPYRPCRAVGGMVVRAWVGFDGHTHGRDRASHVHIADLTARTGWRIRRASRAPGQSQSPEARRG